MRKIVAVVAVMMAAACGPVVGEQCTGTLLCADKSSANFCEGGRFSPVYECAGGCIQDGSTARCDFTGAREGSACPIAAKGSHCEASTMVTCESGSWKWSRTACPGGCSSNGFAISCKQ